jgi:hypothetical protein
MLVTQLVFPFVLWIAAEETAAAPDTLVIGLCAVALFQAGLSVAWGRLVAKTPTPSRWIIRWAFAEAVTLSAFTLGFLGGPMLVTACLMATGFVLTLAQPPREEAAT